MTVDKTSSRIRQMFGEIAPRYDLLNRLLSLGIDRSWRRRTVRLVPPQNEAPILDVCTGTGDLALAYWRACKGRAQVVAADFCHPMLTLAVEKSRRAGARPGIDWVEADAQRLPFSHGQFQIVCVAFGLRNVSDTACCLREMTRVCRPNGSVAVLEFTMPTCWPLRPLYGWYFRHILPRVGQALAKNQQGAYNYLPASVGQFLQRDALADCMRGVGLGQIRFHPFTFGIATLYVGVK